MRSVVLAALFVGLCAATTANYMAEEQYQSLFVSFIKEHGKSYEHDQIFHRYNIFKANMNEVIRLNSQKNTYQVAMNKFGDLNQKEFKALYTGYNPNFRKTTRKVHHHKKVAATAPQASVDWRAKGAVNPVQNQQQCGSCWAFSAVASSEFAIWSATGSLVKLSEQQLVDCSQSFGNQGCEGGLMDQGFQYFESGVTLCSEASYPYSAQDGTCAASNCTAATSAKISGFTDLPQPANEVTDMIPASGTSVLSIAIEADQSCFQFYSGGVLNDPSCGTQLDHGVDIVGYGTDVSGGDYWIVRNSWGNSWGENGYIRLARGVNQCGLTADVSYPTATAKKL